MTLKGVQDGNAVSYTLTFTLCEADGINASAPVHRLATKVQIKLIQDQEVVSAAQDDYHDKECKSLEEYRKKIISLSCQGNIISKYTSFVAIDTEGKKVEGTAVKKSCPVPSLSSEFLRGIQESLMIGCSFQSCGLYDVADASDCLASASPYMVSFRRQISKC
ncbi:uncharacterized protein LOC132713443 [Ruditapes philippinarum]|uniref:uncharacterized protein LOC132713443 n=1 Tax=Ruditapes philippinarum TaxID=129788 RepID=UPI00295AB861|nr:uncharacterized protein LOC132713443 [Ruditapes philippinarum]